MYIVLLCSCVTQPFLWAVPGKPMSTQDPCLRWGCILTLLGMGV